MKFDITSNRYEYCLIIRKNRFTIEYFDKAIAPILGISVEQYQEELSKFGGIIKYDDTIFRTMNEVSNAFQYMDNKYGVMLALL